MTGTEADMANEEHLRILRNAVESPNGVESWNKWRTDNPDVSVDLAGAKLIGDKLSGIDLLRSNLADTKLNGCELTDAKFNGADLTNANLAGGDLSGANLTYAKLAGATLDGTDLLRANLTGTNLADANLSGASLVGAILVDANLVGSTFTNARVGWTIFSRVSLDGINGIRTVKHDGTSLISVDTLELTALDLTKNSSRQQDVELFLEAAGIPMEYIKCFRSRIGRFYSCFISYSTQDQEFADKLYADLNSRNVSCFLASKDMRIGDRIQRKVLEWVRKQDRLLLILSRDSVDSAWVAHEVKEALKREIDDGTDVLFPIRIDDAVMDTTAQWAADIRKERHIGDFREWKDPVVYERSFDRLIRDLHPQ